jgi:ABC-type branched-subunit amino acid transport system ATPase component
MAAVMAVSDTIMVMDYGESIAWGKPSEIIVDQHVIKAYLGRRGIKYA